MDAYGRKNPLPCSLMEGFLVMSRKFPVRLFREFAANPMD